MVDRNDFAIIKYIINTKSEVIEFVENNSNNLLVINAMLSSYSNCNIKIIKS